ncbi:ergothioneine biosynthesis protein EgtB [Flexibacterium corallicola]|uniref:ergothioneine biosynthesis protein EgtB n=1 Tax=Flexibacterium corallicola TaxID=3037259 RepID=UPI00286FAA3F|nr:ergothioneine biosynthesis protein EgtB [Pseudovibrio sp. M1P-2-3]
MEKNGAAPLKVLKRQENNIHKLREQLFHVRTNTKQLAENLSDGDATVQSMEDTSPSKWHLAHTTWFFETVVLRRFLKGYTLFNDRFPYLFNSYYESLGARNPRPRRGMITRPHLKEILDYRTHVDEGLERLMRSPLNEHAKALIELGINHEQQHQELFLTDILHLLAQNPLGPLYAASIPLEVNSGALNEVQWQAFDGGMETFGHEGKMFAFDCEGARHQRFLEPFRLATRAVTNREWTEFMEGGGYTTPTLWLSDGWATVKEEDWSAPLYWENRDGEWWSMTLMGMQPVDLDAPVCHVSYFEADAFASFAGKRLPSEFELELAGKDRPINGNFKDSGRLRPAPVQGEGLSQLFGDVWEWTRSPFTAYPNFKLSEGAVGEYNGKFMNGQYVLKGGSCVTPEGHIRNTYRNFFQPEKRWQFTGVRLAENA